jgi:hypothetical protein
MPPSAASTLAFLAAIPLFAVGVEEAPGKQRRPMSAVRNRLNMLGSLHRIIMRLLTLLLIFGLSSPTAFAYRCDDTPELPTAHGNNAWFCFNNSDTAVIFVHGSLSDNRSAWLTPAQSQKPETYWPRLVVDDPNLQSPSVFLAGYYTPIVQRLICMRLLTAFLFNSTRTQLENPPLSQRRTSFLSRTASAASSFVRS